MKKLFAAAMVALCLPVGAALFSAPAAAGMTPTGSGPQEVVVPAVDDHAYEQVADGLFVGRGTQKLYSREQLLAFQRHADSPVLYIFSNADRSYLRETEDMDRGAQEVRRWLPENLGISWGDLVRIHGGLIHESTPRTLGLTVTSDPGSAFGGAVVIVPGEDFSEDYYRKQMQVNFRPGRMTRELVRQGRVFIAAHEISHVYLFRVGGDSEVGAEMGAYVFARNNPGFFPDLMALERSLLLGRRAYGSMFAGRGDSNHENIPYCAPEDPACLRLFTDSRAPESLKLMETLQQADTDMRQIVAQQLYRQGALPPPSYGAALEAALGRIKFYYTQLPTEQGQAMLARDVKLDANADTAWILRRLLERRGLSDWNSEEAVAVFEALRDGVMDVEARTNDPRRIAAAIQFRQEEGISADDLDRLVQQGRIYCARDLFFRALDAEKTDRLPRFRNGKQEPEGHPVMPLSSSLLAATLQVVLDLDRAGTFDGNIGQKRFAQAFLAGADFYMPELNRPGRAPPGARVAIPPPISAP